MGRLGGLQLKYIEELKNAETFKFEDQYWFLTGDFKSNGQRLCFNMNNGFAKWFNSNDMVDITPVYTLDKDNNTVPIKEYANETNI